jgi:hypothetical protein
MERSALITKYQELFEQVQERNAEWYMCRDVLPCLSSSMELTQVCAELIKLRDACQEHAERSGDVPDSTYGTYGEYMRVKISMFNQVLQELGHETPVPHHPDLIGTL